MTFWRITDKERGVQKRDRERALGELDENLEEKRMISSVNETKIVLKIDHLPWQL